TRLEFRLVLFRSLETGTHLAREELSATNLGEDLFDLSLFALKTTNPEDNLFDLSLFALKTTNPEDDLLDLSLFALGATNPEGAVLDLSRCIAKRLVYNKSLFISAVNGISQMGRGYVQN